MGYSIVIPGADFSATGIRADGVILYKSAVGIRACKVKQEVAEQYGGNTSFISNSAYEGHTYCVDVRQLAGRQIEITFCVGYGPNILGNGGFLLDKVDGVNFVDGWSTTPPTSGSASFTSVNFISTVGEITSEESNTWVTKTYTVPQGAKYLLFTSKYLAGGTAGVELVEEAES